MDVLLVLALSFVAAAAGDKTGEGIVIKMPGVKPTRPDTYLCTSVKLGDKPTKVIGYDPLAKMDTAHHMLLYSCGTPGSDAPVWNCGEMGGGSDADGIPSGPTCGSGFNLIYAWAMDAPALRLPDGVAFKLPAGNTLVVQVHYNTVDKFVKDGVTDDSGIRLLTTESPVPKSAAVYLLGTGGSVPKYQVTYLETACRVHLPKGKEMHPFAFRTHTHKHGRVVSGYRVRGGKWTEIGRGNPRRPQMFYGITGPKDIVIRDGDNLAARCTMYNRHNSDVHMGATGRDEMCNFYMMFWVDGDLPRVGHDCWASGTSYDNWETKSYLKSRENAPLEISKQPPLGPNEEEVVKDPPEDVDKRSKLGTLSEDDPDFVLATEEGGRFYMDEKTYKALF